MSWPMSFEGTSCECSRRWRRWARRIMCFPGFKMAPGCFYFMYKIFIQYYIIPKTKDFSCPNTNVHLPTYFMICGHFLNSFLKITSSDSSIVCMIMMTFTHRMLFFFLQVWKYSQLTQYRWIKKLKFYIYIASGSCCLTVFPSGAWSVDFEPA